MTDTLADMVENFALFEDWEERYRYLIDLGRALPVMPDDARTDQAIVRGCTSKVWLHASRDLAGVYRFTVDSDAHIVRGLIALLLMAYDGKTAKDIASVDVEAFFDSLGLHQHLSPNRRNGFFAMVQRVQSFASGG